MSETIGGIPVLIDPFMPEDEIWLLKEGKRQTIHVHEGPQAGQSIEVWLSLPRIYRIVNLGEFKAWERMASQPQPESDAKI